MQPHTPESLALLYLDQTSVYAGTFFQGTRARAQGEARQLVPDERREETREGSLTEEASWAVESASRSWPRGLLPGEEKGLPLTSVFWQTLYLTPKCTTAKAHGQDPRCLGLLKQQEHRKKNKLGEGRAKLASGSPKASAVSYAPHFLGQGP